MTIVLLVRVDDFRARISCFFGDKTNKNSAWKKAGQRKAAERRDQTCLICRSEYVNVFKRTAVTKEHWLILLISTDNGLNSSWLSEQQRKIGHLTD